MDPASCILYIFFLICSAFFACVETAYTAVNKVRMRTMADKGNKRATKVLWVCQRFDKTLITVLIGNNVFHAACASLSALLVVRQFGEAFVVYGTIITSLIVYLFAEMLPKSLAKARSEEESKYLQIDARKIDLYARFLKYLLNLFLVYIVLFQLYFFRKLIGYTIHPRTNIA